MFSRTRFFSNFLTDDSPHTFLQNIRIGKFLFQCPNMPNSVKVINGQETGSKTLDLSFLDDRTLFSSMTENEPLLTRATSEYGLNPVKQKPFYASSFY